MTKQNIPHYTLMDQLHWSRIALLKPIYQENGRNGCSVYYADGSYDNVRNSCATVREHLAAIYCVNVKEAEKAARQCDGNYRKRAVSIQLSDDCTLVPVICRAAARRNSGTLGYLVLEQLHQYLPTPDGHTLLQFYPDHAGIEILQRYETVRNQIILARQLVQCLERDKARKQQELKYQQLKDPKRKRIGHNW